MLTETTELRDEVKAVIARNLPMPGSRNPYRAYEFAKRQLQAACETPEEYEQACRVYARMANI